MLVVCGCLAGGGGSAWAEGPATAAPAAPYSLPWQLRPAMAVSALRSDTALAFYGQGSATGLTTVTTLLGAYKVKPWLAPTLRLAAVIDDPPTGARSAAFVNPIVGLLGGLRFGSSWRLGLALSFGLPIGMGGGNKPNPETLAATRAGILARSAFDNALFAVNDVTILPGVGLAYVANGLTVQVEATLIQLIRVRGEEVQSDALRTNFTTGLHLGYFLVPQLSLGLELRYQRWLSTPASVKTDPAARDTLTVAGGLRLHFRLRGTTWLRPGLAYTRGLDDPLASKNHNILQIDVPIVF